MIRVDLLVVVGGGLDGVFRDKTPPTPAQNAPRRKRSGLNGPTRKCSTGSVPTRDRLPIRSLSFRLLTPLEDVEWLRQVARYSECGGYTHFANYMLATPLYSW